MIITLRDGSTEVDIDKLIEVMNKKNKKPIDIPLSSFGVMPVTGIFPDGKGGFIRPIDIINDKKKYKQHYERIKKANLQYPILLFGSKNDFEILDGHHRIIKAILDDEPTIKGVFVSKSDLQKAVV